MAISRGTYSPSTIQRGLATSRLRRRDVHQVRCLWWWGKRSRGWWSSDQEELEDRLRRHQALMMHRYTKIMRRRSLWDRENSPPLGWRLRGCRWDREMSSTDPSRAKVEDHEAQKTARTQPWQEFHRDFESFRKAVDRAIERDPYGTLFGRRLRSPDTTNNSSWTSWSWIFDPKEIKEVPKADPAKEGSKPVVPEDNVFKESSPKAVPINQNLPVVTHSSSSAKTTTSFNSSQSIIFQDSSFTTEYVYDPISGRKVPQEKVKTTTSAVSKDPNASKKEPPSTKSVQPKGLFQTLFGEHGFDIPVKTYKPHKVYGFTGEPSSTSKAGVASDRKSFEALETSRKREYNKLRLKFLGNNIDATNFDCEPWNNREADITTGESSAKTDESLEKRIRTSPALNEDVPLFSGTTYASRLEDLQPPRSDWLAKEGFRSKQGMTMPSLRESTPLTASSSEPVTRMETALDRTAMTTTDIPVKKFTSRLQPAIERVVPTSKVQPLSTSEPSVHAQVLKKIASTPPDQREDVDLLRASDVRASSKAARITKQEIEEKKSEERKSLEKDYQARKNAEQEPIGIKDKLFAIPSSTSAHVGAVWKHIKDYPNGIVARTMQSMGLVEAKKDIVQPAIIEKKKTQLAHIPAVSTATIKVSSTSDAQLQKLGVELKDLYEREHGSIDIAASSQATYNEPKSPKFGEPTVKPGVERNLEVERHTQIFEPAVAGIVDKAKFVKRQLHDVTLGLGDVVNQRAITEVATRGLTKREDALLKNSQAAMTVQEPPKTTLEELSKRAVERRPYASPFVLLEYVERSGQVTVKTVENVQETTRIPEVKSIMGVLGSLTQPNQFIQHFADLDKDGYQIVRGQGNTLVFEKRPTKLAESSHVAPSGLASTATLRNTIAAAEAAAQPDAIKAANVLDEIPTSIPTPGPAAPTAPVPTSSRSPTTPQDGAPSTAVPSASIPKASAVQEKPMSPNFVADIPQDIATSTVNVSNPGQASKRKSKSRVNRQEQVFSGQQRLKPQTTALPDPEHFQKQNPSSTASSYRDQSSYEPKLSWFARFRRAVKRVVLTGLAFGTGAYGIGVIAEALQAKAQITNSETGGPMKRLVLEEGKVSRDRQRPGIYSTESSR